MMDGHLEFNDSNGIIDTTVTKEISIKQLDLSEAIRALHRIIKPAIDSCKKTICQVAAILAGVIRGTMHSFRSQIFSTIKRFIRKCLSSSRFLVSRARTTALNLIPFISSLLSFYENNSSNIRDVYLKGTHNKSASEDGFNISFQY